MQWRYISNYKLPLYLFGDHVKTLFMMKKKGKSKTGYKIWEEQLLIWQLRETLSFDSCDESSHSTVEMNFTYFAAERNNDNFELQKLLISQDV